MKLLRSLLLDFLYQTYISPRLFTGSMLCLSRNYVDQMLTFTLPMLDNRAQRRQLHALIKTLNSKLRTDTHKLVGQNGVQKHQIRIWHVDYLGESSADATATNAAVSFSMDGNHQAKANNNKHDFATEDNANRISVQVQKKSNRSISRRQRRGWRGNAVLPLPAGNSLLCGTDQGRRMELFNEAVEVCVL